MSDEAKQLKACQSALRQLASEIVQSGERKSSWSSYQFDGWVDMIAGLLDEELDHLKLDDPDVETDQLRTHVNVAIAYLDARIGEK